MKFKLNANIHKAILNVLSEVVLWLRPKKEQFIYVSLGDSSVAGIGATHPKRSYTGIIYEHLKLIQKHIAYYNFGKSGATLHDVVSTQMEPAISQKPSLITISIGANDLRYFTSMKQFAKELEILLKTLKKRTESEIVINTIPPLMYAPAVPKYLRVMTKLLVSRMNAIIQKIADKTDVSVVDVYKQCLIFVRDYPEIISEDGFHPSDFGYALWANTILAEITHLLQPRKHMFSR